MKRVRVHIEGESDARQAGLRIAQMQKEGFLCTGCGTPQTFSRHVLDNWGSMLVHTCQTCGAQHKMQAGKITQISGPTRSLKRVRNQEAQMQKEKVDPRTPQWRAYRLFMDARAGATYRAVSKYHPTLDLCNADAWNYAGEAEPLHRNKRDAVFAGLLRREEFPLMTQVETNGMPTGFGEIIDAGETPYGVSTFHHFTMKDPKGRETTVAIRPEDFKRLLDGWGLTFQQEETLRHEDPKD